MTERTFFGLFGLMLVIQIACLGFLGWVIYAVLSHFGIV